MFFENGVMKMKTFIENVNEYLKQRKLKQTYVSLVTGWSAAKVSRVLSGNNDLNYNDMQTLSKALGESLDYFINGTKEMMKSEQISNNQMAFCAGKLSPEECIKAEYLIDMFRYYEELMDC